MTACLEERAPGSITGRRGPSRPTQRTTTAMAYADILCFLDASKEAVDRLRIAATLAAAHGALLTGIDATAGEVSSAAVHEVGARFRRSGQSLRCDRQVYSRRSARRRIVCPLLHRSDRRAFPRRTLQRLHPPRTYRKHIDRIRAPVLMLPAGTKIRSLGETVIVAWNGAREALRAVHDALPILEACAHSDRLRLFLAPGHPARIRASPDGASWPAWRRHESRRLDQRQRPVAGRGAARLRRGSLRGPYCRGRLWPLASLRGDFRWRQR